MSEKLVELELDTDTLKATLLPIMHLLEDDSINEVKISPLRKDIGAVWYYKQGSWEEALDKNGQPLLIDNKKIEQVIGYMAGANKKPAHDKRPKIECVVPLLGFRFTGILQPMSVGCSKFNIRKFSTTFYTFEDYAKQGVFGEEYIETLLNWTNNKGAFEQHDKFSIAIFGTTNTGKTTFTNCFINEKRKNKPKENWVVMEDTRELIIKQQNMLI
jgi:Flp pilus assembly CpaF family ATPase